MKRDPTDPARLQMVPVDGRNERGRSPGLSAACSSAADPKLPDWAGQEAAAFPDNWTVGMSFYPQRLRPRAQPVRRRVPPAARRGRPTRIPACAIPSDAEPGHPLSGCHARRALQAARLVVAAEIAKIHTIEWTPQLLYDEPLFMGMNGNWTGS